MVEEEPVLEHVAERSQRGCGFGARPRYARGSAAEHDGNAHRQQSDGRCLDERVDSWSIKEKETHTPLAHGLGTINCMRGQAPRYGFRVRSGRAITPNAADDVQIRAMQRYR
jgi:hypothetical protein